MAGASFAIAAPSVQQPRGEQGAAPDGATEKPDAADHAQYDPVIEYFRPQRMEPHDLLGLIRQLGSDGFLSRRVRVGEDKIKSVNPTLIVYGDQLLVKDTRHGMKETIDLLREFDARYEEPEGRSTAEKRLAQFEVKHVALQAVSNTLSTLYLSGSKSAGHHPAPPRVSVLSERNLVLVRGSEEQIDEAGRLIAQLDVPRPRVLLSCYIVKGVEESENDPRVPTDLAADLSQLVPFAGFDLLTSAILPSDTNQTVNFEADLDDGSGELQMYLDPVAYDDQTGTLTLGKVRFGLVLTDGMDKSRRSFETSTSLRRGQYTVLGAVGADPIFAVIKLTSSP